MRVHMRFVALNLFIALFGFWIGRWTRCNHYPVGTYFRRTFDNITVYSSNITVVSFCNDEESRNVLDRFVELHPEIRVLAGFSEEMNIKDAYRYSYIEIFASRGEALNELISKVETAYVLHLDAYHEVSARDANRSVDLLLETMENLTMFDLIGGSVIVEQAHKDVNDVLEIPCYRLHHYNYTYWETYEYEESVEDVMICQRTSTSFLANTTALRIKGLVFDPQLDELMFEDFFLQSKIKQMVIGTKPGIQFILRKFNDHQKPSIQHFAISFIPGLISFGLKHQVMVVKDIDGQIFYICERYSTMGTKYHDKSLGSSLFKDEVLLCEYDNTKPFWKMKHWAYGGTFAVPTMRMALKRSLADAGDFFDSKNWSWYVDGGGVLGAIKTRGLLPWEAGDVDIDLNMTIKQCSDILQKEFLQKYPDYNVVNYHNSEVIIKPKRGFGGWVTIFPNRLVPTVRMNLDGYWAPVKYDKYKDLLRYYGVNYLQHKMHDGKQLTCREQSNACLPNYRKLYIGRGGVWREFFEEVWEKSSF